MDLASNFKGLIFKICFICLACSILLWISIFSYGILYYLYIPAVAHSKPIYFKYDTSCRKGDLCKHPYDNVTLIKQGHHELLRRGQSYTVEVVLEMPESERNLNQGMFMIRLDMLSQSGFVLMTSKRPALLHYKSFLFKVIYTLLCIPALLAGSVEEKQTLTISLFEQYVEDNYYPAHYAYIEIEAQAAEIYSALLRIHAQFTGLRYVMYYWPVLSAAVGIGINFFILSIFVVFIWIRQIMNAAQVVQIPSLSFGEEQQIIKEAKRRAKEKQFQKSSGQSMQSSMGHKDDDVIENLPMRTKEKGKLTNILHQDSNSEGWVNVSSSTQDTEYCAGNQPVASLTEDVEQGEDGSSPEVFKKPLVETRFSPPLRKRLVCESL